MLPKRRHLVVLPLAAMIAVLPLMLRGCSCGHDFDFHIISWFEAAKQFAHGTLYPRWAYTPAWNAGEPRFIFYPPLSWTLGGLLGLVLPWSWTPVAYSWIALTAAGLSLHSVARRICSPSAALVAAAAYIVNPYTLYTVYERSAYAELLAAAWLPLLLYAFLRERVEVRLIAVPVALLWLTNAPAAVMGCYVAAAITLMRMALSPRQRKQPLRELAGKTATGTLLGLGLAAVYILPAVTQRHLVQVALAVTTGLSPRDNFLFAHTSDPEHDAVLHTASIVALVMLALTAAVMAWVQVSRSAPQSEQESANRDHGNVTQQTPLLLLLTGAIIAFMLTPLSSAVWSTLPQLAFLQFPWRLLAILAVVFALGLSLALTPTVMPARAVALILAALLTLPAYLAFHQLCYPEDTLAARLATFRSANPGTDPTDEYTPVIADNDALQQGHPGYWIAAQASEAPPAAAVAGAAPHRLQLHLDHPSTLILNLREYPSWRIQRNGQILADRLQRDDGLTAVPLPAGDSLIEIRWHTSTTFLLGNLISSLSLLLLTILVILHHRGTWVRERDKEHQVRILKPFA